MGVKHCDGWCVPESDVRGAPAILRSLEESIELVLRYVPRPRACIQAGGCFGAYPHRLAQAFGCVYTFEADAENFGCLMRNGMPKNVMPFHAALWDRFDTLGVTGERSHMGMLQVGPGTGVVARRIDFLDLDVCDLIYLDIEGAEYRALLGAAGTIIRCRPVIAFEDNGRASQLGDAPDAAKRFLESLGYRHADRVHKDEVMVPC